MVHCGCISMSSPQGKSHGLPQSCAAAPALLPRLWRGLDYQPLIAAERDEEAHAAWWAAMADGDLADLFLLDGASTVSESWRLGT